VRAGDIYFAWHGQYIVENGWEPYDQPSTAAYIPFRFTDLFVKNFGQDRVLVRLEEPAPYGFACAVEKALQKARAPKALMRKAVSIVGLLDRRARKAEGNKSTPARRRAGRAPRSGLSKLHD